MIITTITLTTYDGSVFVGSVAGTLTAEERRYIADRMDAFIPGDESEEDLDEDDENEDKRTLTFVETTLASSVADLKKLTSIDALDKCTDSRVLPA